MREKQGIRRKTGRCALSSGYGKRTDVWRQRDARTRRSGMSYIMRLFASGGFFAKYLRIPLRTASAIWF
jgi:hypothetical protein